MFSKYYDPTLLLLLVFIAFAWLGLIWYNQKVKGIVGASDSDVEGFQQVSPYVLKQGWIDTYDEFYAQIYPEIMVNFKASASEILKPVFQATMPSTTYSLFLDVGCGTGAVVNEIAAAGYRVIGVDRSSAMISSAMISSAMISSAMNSVADSDIRLGDVSDPMLFDRRIFSHILLVDQVIYEWTLEETRQILLNCSHWLKRGGCLVLHLIDSDFVNRGLNHDFGSFTYSSKYERCSHGSQSSDIVRVETFTDLSSQHVRSNENVLHLSPVGDILKLAEQVGFSIQAKWVLSSSSSSSRKDGQYIYLLTI
jgi:SAM-dependent methyltransferase